MSRFTCLPWISNKDGDGRKKKVEIGMKMVGVVENEMEWRGGW